MSSVVNGLVGGLIATVVMTVFMELLGDESPPLTAIFWSKYIGGASPEEYTLHGLALHLVYGASAGGVFEHAAGVLKIDIGTVDSGVLWGSMYGVLLFVIGVGFWMRLILGVKIRTKMLGMSLFFHLVYGVVHGAWAGFGIIG
ncbi:hypothetical protein ACEU6E_02390 [Halorutilales archaeon Cl-col2-1]